MELLSSIPNRPVRISWGRLLLLVFMFLPLVAGRAASQPSPAPVIGDPLVTDIPAADSEQSPNVRRSAGQDQFLYLPQVMFSRLDPFVQEVIELTNSNRALHGCGPLQVSNQLNSAAQGHSEDMALQDFFSHTSPNGDLPWDRIRATGYVYSRAAENIAAGYSTPAAVMAGWMNSSGHRANILNCDLTEIGVGYYYLATDTGTINYHHYWTQVFATPR